MLRTLHVGSDHASGARSNTVAGTRAIRGTRDVLDSKPRRAWTAVLCGGVASIACIGASVFADPPLADPALANLDFEQGAAGEQPPGGWIVPTAGWKAELVDTAPASGKLAARLTFSGAGSAPYGNLMRRFDAAPFRGRHVKLSAKLRVAEPRGSGQAQMWLRVDRDGGEMGAFDNMGDRPVTAATWTDAVIAVDIDPDAAAVNIGFISTGDNATIHIDDVSLVISGEPKPPAPKQPASHPGPLSERGVENLSAATRLLAYIRFFHPSDQAVNLKDWDRFTIRVIEDAEPAADAADLANRLAKAFEPIAPTLQVWAGTPDQSPPLPPAPAAATATAEWIHLGAGTVGTIKNSAYRSRVERKPRADQGPPSEAEYAGTFLVKPLGGGVSARFALRVFANADGTIPNGKTPAEFAGAERPLVLTATNRLTRFAGISEAWGIFQHFYPYFDIVKTDWDSTLAPSLRKAAIDPTELDYLATLRELVAQLHDGHGNVSNPSLRAKNFLPLAVEWAGHDLVVVGKHADVSPDVRIGDAIVAIDGRPIEDIFNEVSKRVSAATDGWRRVASTRPIVINYPTADPAEVTLRHPDGMTISVKLSRIAEPVDGSAIPARPKQAAELAPGIAYFNLDGADSAALDKALPTLAAAKGIIFDLRGYPGSAGYELMSHLIDGPATSARWNVPIVTRPDREGWTWNESGRWPLTPKAPRLTAKLAFLTDGRAISYAESVMGIVEAYKFGEIVGSTTAGTNGNINPFVLPGGYSVNWTGMKVLKHDGSPHHGVGIAPTIPVTPTPKGIAEGKDEVLARAIEVLSGRLVEPQNPPRAEVK